VGVPLSMGRLGLKGGGGRVTPKEIVRTQALPCRPSHRETGSQGGQLGEKEVGRGVCKQLLFRVRLSEGVARGKA